MDQATQKKYNYWQWRTLILLMIGYMLFYFVRKNFSITMPALESELGISKTTCRQGFPQEDDGPRTPAFRCGEHPDRSQP